MSVDLEPYRRLAELVHGPGFGTSEYLTLRSRLMRDLPAILAEVGAMEVSNELLRARCERQMEQLQRWTSLGVGLDMIVDERRRQVEEEGFDAEHDAAHRPGELLNAGISYAIRAELDGGRSTTPVMPPPARWPWRPEEWKPSDDPLQNLVRAAALIAAEIDRLLEGRIGG